MTPQERAARRAKRPKLGLLAGILIYLGLVLGVTAGLFLVRVLIGVVTGLVARFVFGSDWGTAVFASFLGYLIASFIFAAPDCFDWKKKKERNKLRAADQNATGAQE